MTLPDHADHAADPLHSRLLATAKESPAAAILAIMVFLLPAVGMPSELMLQDTLKSAVVAFGVLLAAMVFFWSLRGRVAPLYWHGLVALPFVLVLYALGSMAWSHTYLAGTEAIRWFIFGLLAWLSMNCISRPALPLLAWGIHWGAVIASLWTALQFWFDLRLFPQAALPGSTFVNRNFYAEYLICALPWSVFALTSMRFSRWVWWVAFSLALNLVGLMMTGTRSALLAFLLIAPIMGFAWLKYKQQFGMGQWSRQQRILVTALVVICTVGLGSVGSNNPAITSEAAGSTPLQRSISRTASMAAPGEYTEGSFSIRAAMWKATVRMMLAHGLVGVGAGAWEVQIPLYQDDDTVYETDYYAHNEYLQLLSEYGLVTGGLFLAFLLSYLMIAAGRTWRLHGPLQSEAPLRATVLLSLLAMLVVSNAGFPWHLAGSGALFAIGLGVLCVSDQRLGQHQRFFTAGFRLSGTSNKVLAWVFVALLGVAGYITNQARLAEMKIVHALKLSASAFQPQDTAPGSTAATKALMLQEAREGIAITPHYRRLTAMLAEPLSASGDWENTAWILESVAQSRPNVVAIWSGLATAYSRLGQYDQAMQALSEVKRLKPKAIATRTLAISLLYNSRRLDEAAALLSVQYDRGEYDYDMVQVGAALGYETRNWPLTVRSLELRNLKWTQFAADGHFRLGQIYANDSMMNDARALQEFKLGLALVPADYVGTYLKEVPIRFRSAM